jgi:phosphoribosylglycinamide formyltransferase 2
VILVEGKSDALEYSGLEQALAEPDTQLRLFGKPQIDGQRRMGVVLVRDENTDQAVDRAKAASDRVKPIF